MGQSDQGGSFVLFKYRTDPGPPTLPLPRMFSWGCCAAQVSGAPGAAVCNTSHLAAATLKPPAALSLAPGAGCGCSCCWRCERGGATAPPPSARLGLTCGRCVRLPTPGHAAGPPFSPDVPGWPAGPLAFAGDWWGRWPHLGEPSRKRHSEVPSMEENVVSDSLAFWLRGLREYSRKIRPLHLNDATN